MTEELKAVMEYQRSVHQLDLLLATRQANDNWIPTSHYPSQASAIIDCPACEGTGGVPTEDGFAPCKACNGGGHVLIGTCLREQFWKYIGAPVSNKSSLASFFKRDIGSIIEKWWLMRQLAQVSPYPIIYKSDPFDQRDERLRFYLDEPRLRFSINGELDGMGLLPGGYIETIECKTSYGRGATKVRKSGNIPSYYWVQIEAFYARRGVLAKYPDYTPAPLIRFFMGARDNGYWGEMRPVPSDGDVLYEAAVARWMLLEKHLLDGETPPPELKDAEIDNTNGWAIPGAAKTPWSCWRCSGCAYLDKCKEECRGMEATGPEGEGEPE